MDARPGRVDRGLLAAGVHDEARATLVLLYVTQHPDGHWPQNMRLDGERVWRHEELDEAALPIRLLHAMEACANETGMLPEQVWDGPHIPDRGLYHGGPTGSAAPLGWAHAEYVKLCRSLADDRVFDLPSVRL